MFFVCVFHSAALPEDHTTLPQIETILGLLPKLTLTTAWMYVTNKDLICVCVRFEFRARHWTQTSGDGQRQPQASDERRGGRGGGGGVRQAIRVGPASRWTPGWVSPCYRLHPGFLSAWSALCESEALTRWLCWSHHFHLVDSVSVFCSILWRMRVWSWSTTPSSSGFLSTWAKTTAGKRPRPTVCPCGTMLVGSSVSLLRCQINHWTVF